MRSMMRLSTPLAAMLNWAESTLGSDLGGQHLAKVLRQGDGEVAVAAVELQQISLAPPGHVQRPAQHLLVDGGVGLGEAVFHLLVDQLATPAP